ncbi:zinc-binding dehydrogenase [Fontisphaera persica]|uniref:zinc-dependent alcohol dehydrogenase n=1 Tax=Fontisphaera persica TaxID=2974023 RepID=UPI0024BFB066|nr:zinc-binding dehydrogenase [Fontisphaera persica]WCJ60457.1 zinc-binding dehydrogenase [Fontisphaera persica]
MPRAVQFIRSVPRWLWVRSLAGRWPEIATGSFSCLQFAEVAPPPLPRPNWVRLAPRLSGICGSDLSTIACKGSPYFSPFVSTPFVLGHEVVGEIVETGSATPSNLRSGMRVVLEPALGCEVRGMETPCRPCAAGQYANCENILRGCLQGGFQTGYCASTGGGWSHASLVAHPSQVHPVPDALSDEEAVLAEPLACSLHAALKAPREKEKTLLVIGCGTIGLLLIAAYRMTGGQGRVLAVARFPHQAEMARQLGADECIGLRPPAALYQWVLERTGSLDAGGGIYQPELGKPVVLGGADAVLDCVGIGPTMDDALRLTRPGGLVLLVGMPGIPSGIDWTSAWYKELRVHGSYAYGWETLPGGRRVKTIQLALELLAASGGRLRPLVSKKLPLTEFRAAIAHAFHTEQPGNFKTVFDLRV